MKLKFASLVFFFLTFFFGFLFTKPAFASSYTLSGHVSDSSNTPIVGATVDVIDSNTSANAGSVTTNSSGDYSLILVGGTYNVQVTPPTGSGFSPAITYGHVISSDTILNYVLATIGQVNFTGHLFDPHGAALQNQTVGLYTGSGTILTAKTNTDSDGKFSLTVPAGGYTLKINSGDSYLIIGSISLSQSSDYNFTIPFINLNVHVQDATNAPVNGVTLHALPTNGFNAWVNFNLNLGNGITAQGTSQAGATTDASGDATLSLIQSDGGAYTITATPPSGSIYSTTNLSGVAADVDKQISITLEQPVVFSGHLYDPHDTALQNQTVGLYTGSGTILTAKTNTDGNGAFQLTVPHGSYTLKINSGDSYFIQGNITLSQNTDYNFTIPLIKLDVNVQNAAGIPVNGIAVNGLPSNGVNGWVNFNLNLGNGVTAQGTSQSGAATDATGTATLFLIQSDGGAYTISATPPSGSVYSTTNISGVAADVDKQITITLKQLINFTGHLYDPHGTALQNQTVGLYTGSGTILTAKTNTDTDGRFSLTVPAGGYTLKINSGDSYLIIGNISLLQDTDYNLTIPLYRLDVHVQDATNTPVNGVGVNVIPTNGFNAWVNFNLNLGNGITAQGTSQAGATTNVSGDATLSLIQSDGRAYTISATPPSGSIYTPFILNGFSFTNDQTEIISLQYKHATPVTTIDLQIQHQDGTYSDPTTVTLSATAAAGFSIANTYYKVDGGSQQTYSSQFTVTGEGNHSIEYWSIDNSGVQEAHHTKNFTIHINHAPYVNPFPGASLTVGDTYTAASSFTDPDSASWSATVDYDDGAGPENLPLNPDKTFNLSHQYNTAGTYTVTVVVTDDGGATGTTMATVIVVAPTATPTPTNTPTPTPTNTPTPTPTNTPTPTPTSTPTPTPSTQLTALAPAKVWIGLKNSDDVGVKFDVKVEAYKDSTLVSSGELDSFAGGSSGFNNAHLATILFNSFSPVDFPSGSQLKLEVYVRNACVGSGHNSGFARLWYNDSQADSQFGSTIGGSSVTDYLLDNFVLGLTTGPTKKTIDVQSGTKCSDFKPFGTWTITP